MIAFQIKPQKGVTELIELSCSVVPSALYIQMLMLAGVTPFGLHRLPVIYRAFGTACANNYIITFVFH